MLHIILADLANIVTAHTTDMATFCYLLECSIWLMPLSTFGNSSPLILSVCKKL